VAERPRRKRTRVRAFDHRTPGVYFVTLVTQGRACWSGEVVEGKVLTNAAGHMVERWWISLPGKFTSVSPAAFVVMPSHLHGLPALNLDFS